jgi:hypothetical protein
MTAWGGFRDDLGAALRAWQHAPGLPLLTIALFAAQLANGYAVRQSAWFVVVAIILGLFSAGFVGTQRIWYLRAFRNDRLETNELGPLTWAFLGRFVCLGLLTGIPFLFISLVLLAAAPSASLIVSIAWTLMLDFALTFVTPALAFTTRSTTTALRIGLSTIRRSWSEVKWYVLAPGIVSVAIIWLRPSGLSDVALGFFYVAGGLVALSFKGAVARYYLRAHPEVTDVGAAYEHDDPYELDRWTGDNPDTW